MCPRPKLGRKSASVRLRHFQEDLVYMKIVRSLLLLGLAAFIAVSIGMGKAEYSKKEGKACTFCHPPGKFKELTDAGKYYKEHNHSLEGYKAPEKK
jgi:hypothetical protein